MYRQPSLKDPRLSYEVRIRRLIFTRVDVGVWDSGATGVADCRRHQ